MQQQKLFKTADLSFAAYLSVAGVPLEEAVKNSRRVFFHFVDEGQIDELKKQYFQRKARVPALPYAEEMKNFKNMVHEIMGQD